MTLHDPGLTLRERGDVNLSCVEAVAVLRDRERGERALNDLTVWIALALAVLAGAWLSHEAGLNDATYTACGLVLIGMCRACWFLYRNRRGA